ncbi:MAG: hypothetical protein ACOVT5_01935 [Armatimonadaceae bacterium]
MNGVILYEGPSLLDGAPVVAIATGLKGKSRNEKTGDMVQTWILRADVAPHEAIHTGEDASVCGDCPHRGRIEDGRNVGRSCYVTTFQAPLSVWKAYRRGLYPAVSREDVATLFAGRMVRLGSYGDPAAIPVDVWQNAVARASGWTGYTHQWRTAPRALAALCMASVETDGQARAARLQGWRTFRVRAEGQPLAPKLEFICPASAEAGMKTDCASCRACMGTESKAKASPVIIAHGAGRRAASALAMAA